jgi:hypothetical protein
VIELGLSLKIEKPFVIDIVTNSNTNLAVTPSPEYNPKGKLISDLLALLVKEVLVGQEKAIAPALIT